MLRYTMHFTSIIGGIVCVPISPGGLVHVLCVPRTIHDMLYPLCPIPVAGPFDCVGGM